MTKQRALESYAGPAVLSVAGYDYDVQVTLRGHFQPIDGWYHWYGRISAHPGLAAALDGKQLPGVLRTPDGEAEGRLSDPDPWGRYRITGTSTPPFQSPTSR